MTANVVRINVLEPALEARAHNDRQAQLVANPSPEVDSLVEHFTELVRLSTRAQRPHLQAIFPLLKELAESNTAEGECEQQIAGVADQIATDLRDHELNGPGAQWTANEIARQLRAPLADLLNPMVTMNRKIKARHLVNAVIGTAPRTLLLGKTVRYQLGERKHTLLLELAA